jgi:hypothetical protein
MNRRKFLAMLGTAAAGTSAAVGTGAFTSVSADRSVSVQVADDADAFLAMTPSNGPNGDYASSNDGELVVQLNGSDGTPSGSGVNDDAVTKIKDVFRMRNQGTQRIYVYIEDSSDLVTFKLSRASRGNPINDNPVSRLTPHEIVDIEGTDNAVLIGTGLEVKIHMFVDTTGDSTPESLLDKVTIQAQAEPPSPSPFD